MSTLKERKESFVSGLEGGTILEVNIVTSIALFAYFSYNLITIRGQDYGIVAEFSLLWVTLLLSVTTYANNAYMLITLILVPCISLFLCVLINKKSTKLEDISKKDVMVHDEDASKKDLKKFELVKSPYLTAYRGGMLVLTMISIFAVDFNIFPRRFAKVETWGTSLMDLGVGSFVFSNGIVSARSLIKEKMDPKYQRSTLMGIILGFKSGLSLLILGLLRLYFVKNLEYQEHVTEYGVHWNFFLTLALLPPFLSILNPIAEYIPRVVIALVISLVYEWFLMRNDNRMLTFLILGERNNFFSANREGILSFFGYCSIFLFGQSTGFYILGNQPTKNNLYKPSSTIVSKTNINNNKMSLWDRITTVSPLRGLFTWALLSMIATNIIFTLHPFDISRRFANISYTAWTISYNLAFLTCYCMIDSLFGNTFENYKSPLVYESVNRNGLFMFLLSNVSTGLGNMAFSTIDASDSTAIAVLMGYSIFLVSVSILLHQRQIYIKF
ncbi:hypothetical protein TPHA_0I00950 [Tetrapisispora phaffii CBS 4417]|uniref:GPI-anchored wall transfer protein n=1 Tax=Tetrapisispora phaffii (strain ATCC 24235 / CBS 4417 / NBRC 1672 / NRRL Y-8282 / UCD 70-5) TaxID=1071381 RepID=G8BXH3_TETPH|nr:hypothetical protein TPHA_0I00950 [Tetrapisispora phaffii CBS 4417]CCE64601.1 hypothetical protein TPHA_0I00950 [Tetrapisispora phaffii CBS 4417]